MSESAPTGNSNVVYPKFGRGPDAFDWPEHIDWSECGSDADAEQQQADDGPQTEEVDVADGQLADDNSATVLEFPVRDDQS